MSKIQNQVGTAIIGCGNVSKAYIEQMQNYPQVKLLGFYDPIAERAKEYAEQFGRKAYTSIDDLLNDPEVEIVLNLTIHTAHAEVVRKCLEHGKHVHSEKPLAMTGKEAWELVELADKMGVRLSSAPINYMGEAQDLAWNMLRTGKIGTVRLAYCEVNHGRIEAWHPNPLPFYNLGVMWDVGVYPITLITAFFGPVKRVLCYGKVLMKDHIKMNGESFQIDVPDFYLGILELQNGVTCRLSTNFYTKMSYQGGTLEFHGDEGRIKLGDFQNFSAIVETGEYGKPYQQVNHKGKGERNLELARGVQELATAILENRPHKSSPTQAAHVVDVIQALLESSVTNKFVDVNTDFIPPVPMNYKTE